MAISSSDAIYLGNFADADTNEFSFSLESPSVYLGSFGSSGAPLHEEITEVTYDDADNSGDMITDNSGTEQISYNLGASTIYSQVDSLAVVNVTVTYTDGSSASYSNAVMYQDNTGNLFLTNSDFAGTDLNGPNNMPIESINVTAITGDGYNGLFQNALQSFVCFAAGSLIRTPDGERPVETLRVGDLVDTLDHGPQPIRWTGGRAVPSMGRMSPVRIAAGALGAGLPRRDLWVSQQHRMLIASRIAERMFGTAETLIPAKRLIGLPGITLDRRIDVISYHHFLCDRHEIVLADAAPAETLLPGPVALGMMHVEAVAEITALFPELAALSADRMPEAARTIPKGPKLRRLIARHMKNAQPLVSGLAA